jgi:hypothetical protein
MTAIIASEPTIEGIANGKTATSCPDSGYSEIHTDVLPKIICIPKRKRITPPANWNKTNLLPMAESNN